MKDNVLVAGIGNIFFSDDGFGPAVTAALAAEAARRPLPDRVRVIDYGIRGLHLSYDLLGGVDALILIDAVPAGTGGHTAAGTVVRMEIGAADVGQLAPGPAGAAADGHSISPVAVLASLEPMGGRLPLTYLIGCIPAEVTEGIGLSAAVEAAVGPAAVAVRDLVRDLVAPSPITEAVS